MERAAAATVAAFKAAISSTRPGLWERDIEAVMDLEFTRHGAAGPGYGAIVGSGPNSLVLHYMGSHRRMVAGDVLLVDYGPEVDHYVIDVTRTWPVDGTFTARQAELYDAVLTAQKAAIAECKPGNTVMAINRTAIRVLQDKGFGRFVRHGVCHLIGMEVHDPGNLLRPLKPGVCFTVEPGLYERSTGIGIRIEDVVVITEDGCRVLTDGIPKERTAVEALYRENGPLDLLRPSTGR